ncbi:MAG: LLM class F420-dependent oxidoreductase [Candidatus Rokuibacteriota bacterium]|nr:MAG: LLM class F420-dependent oxidoreductase [Candidatus Rokubacteria bacterium]
MLTFGLFSINAYACCEPAVAARVARAAEAAGFDSLWGGEHVVLPDPQAPPSPMAPHEPILDPVIALTYCAAVTSRVRLGTGIIILPQRNPLVLAKELASLDALSGGRLIFGVGVGYLEAEFRALGAPFEQRGAVADDYLAAMRAIWSQDTPAHRGRFVSFAGVQAYPRPVQRPHPPIVIGGRTPPAFRRAVEQGHGWYGFALDPARTATALEGLREAAARVARPAHLGPLEISVTPARGTTIDAATAHEYARLGVHRLILMPPPKLDADGLERFVADVGSRLIGKV